MGILRGGLTITTFQATSNNAATKHTAASLEKSAESRRFLPLRPTGEVSESAGWVPLEAPFDDEMKITSNEMLFGDLVALSYREDKYVIPKALLRRETQKRINKIIEEEKREPDSIGRAFVKAVEAAVLVELKAKTIPRSKVVEVVWDMAHERVYVFGTGTIATERIASLVERTFEIRIEQLTPAMLAATKLGDTWKETFKKRMVEVTTFGSEFLTYLYFRLLRDPELYVPQLVEDPVQFAVGKTAHLHAPDGTGAAVTLAGRVDESSELLAAVHRGALVNQLGIEFSVASAVYSATLAHDGTMRMKLPDLFTEPDEDDEKGTAAQVEEAKGAAKGKPKKRAVLPLEDVLALRVEVMARGQTALETMFGEFLDVRLNSGWDATIAETIKTPARDGLRARLNETLHTT